MGALAIYDIQYNKDIKSSAENLLTLTSIDDIFKRPIIFDSNKTTSIS